MKQSVFKARRWLGLNNKADRTSPPRAADGDPAASAVLALRWLETADDVDIDDGGNIRTAPGATEALTDIVDGYHTHRGDRLYLIDASQTLIRFDGSIAEEIYSDVGEGPYAWTEYGTAVYLMGSEQALEIRPTGVVGWGLPVPTPAVVSVDSGGGSMPAGVYQIALTYLRSDGIESGAPQSTIVTIAQGDRILLADIPAQADCQTLIYCSPADGPDLYLVKAAAGADDVIDGDPATWTYPLRTQFTSPPPLSGHLIEGWDARIWVAVYDSTQNITRLFPSTELRRFVLDVPMDVRGCVTVMAGTPESMLVGTDREIYALSRNGEGYQLSRLAGYGVIPGSVDWDNAGNIVFWTSRGAMSAFPLKSLTEHALSVPPGTVAAGLVREYRGYRSYLVSPRGGGTSHNPYGDRLSPTDA